jgi:hypothetical protein
MFKDFKTSCLDCFVVNSGIIFSLHTELNGVMFVIEIAMIMNQRNLWLETDCKLTVMTFKTSFTVPSKLKNRWLNCISLENNWYISKHH